MAWIELHDNVWEHHKTVKICNELGASDIQIVGHLVSLWQFTMRNAPDTGNLAAWGDCGVARAARWTGDAESFCNALRNAGLMEGHKIHDWDEFTLHFKASRQRVERKREMVRERVKNYREKQCNASCNAHVTLSNAPCNAPVTLGNAPCNAPVTLSNADTKPNLTKPNLTKPNQANNDWPGFDAFWKAYPNKVGKLNALKSWNKLKPDDDLQAIMLSAIGIQSRSEKWTADGGRYISNPTTWLNGALWQDDLKPASNQPEVFIPSVIDPEMRF